MAKAADREPYTARKRQAPATEIHLTDLDIEIELATNAMQAETSAFDSERGLPTSAFHGATLYTTMSPCWMCTGAAIWFQVAKVVIGDNVNYTGPEDVLRSNGIEVVVLNTDECVSMSRKFIESSPDKWSDTVRKTA